MVEALPFGLIKWTVIGDISAVASSQVLRSISEGLIALACLMSSYLFAKFIREHPSLPIAGLIKALIAFLIALGLIEFADAILLTKQSSFIAAMFDLITAIFASILAWVAVISLHRFIPTIKSLKSRPDLEREIELRIESLNKLNIELRQTEERFRLVVEAVPNGIIMVGPDGAIRLVNALTEKLFGYERYELIGQPVELLLPLQVRAQHPFDRERYFANPETRAMGSGRDLKGRRKDGSEFPVEIGLNPLRTTEGVQVLASIVDISKRKESEEAANQSRKMLRLVIDNIPQGVFWKDANSRYLGCNLLVAKSLGFDSPEGIVGKCDDEITSLTAKEAADFIRKDRETMASNQSVLDIVEPMTMHDGRTIWLNTNKVPMHDDKGRVIGVLGTWQDITERKRVEEEQRKLTTLIEYSHDFIAVADLDGRITFMNLGAKRMIGLDEDADPSQLKFNDYVPENWLEYFANTVLPTARDTGLWEGEMQLRHMKTGELIDVYRSTFMIRDSEDRPGFYATVTRDITGAKRAEVEIHRLNADLENRVRERTAELEEAQRLARVGSWVWHLEDNRVEWSSELYRLMGFDSSQPAPPFEKQESLFTPLSWLKLRQAVNKSLSSGDPFQEELNYRQANGSWGMMRSAGESERDADGKLIRLMGTAQDITELRRTEAELRKVTERLTLATEAGRVGIWDWDIPANILTWDQMMYELYGITAPQFSGAYDAWQTGVHPEDRKRGDEEIHMALRGEKDFDTEFRVSWPDGNVHVIRAHAIVRRDESGNPLRMIGTNWDITEIKVAEESIRSLNETLKRQAVEVGNANRELEAFSYSVSHDLRAPLRAIDGFSRIIMEDYGGLLPAEAREYLQDVRTGTQQMGRLVDDLLDFSRLGRQTIRKIKVDTDGMVRQCVDELKTSVGNRRIEFVIGALPACHGDPSLLKQVWLNLLGNAVKYTGKRESATVEIGSRKEPDGELVYFVRDNGVGFDMRYAHKLFGVFQRLHRSEEYEGTGVGLAIVQRIVNRHGGRVRAESEPDKGAAFFFTLPAD